MESYRHRAQAQRAAARGTGVVTVEAPKTFYCITDFLKDLDNCYLKADRSGCGVIQTPHTKFQLHDQLSLDDPTNRQLIVTL